MGCVVPFRLPTHTDAPTQVGSRIILWVHGGGNIGTTAHQYLAFVGYLLSETTGQVVLLPSWPSRPLHTLHTLPGRCAAGGA